MSGEQKTTKESEFRFNASSCKEMMGQMMGKSREEMNCESIVSQFLETDDLPDEWVEMMSQMDPCCGSAEKVETTEKPL